MDSSIIDLIYKNKTDQEKEEIRKVEGAQPYILSRLEYFAFVLNMSVPVTSLLMNHRCFIWFFSDTKENKIKITMAMPSNIEETITNNIYDSLESIVYGIAKSYGWDSWVKVEQHLIPLEDLESGII